MFVQLMFGEPADADVLRRRWEAWRLELAPGAPGWLGLTAGLSTQGPFCNVVRFESEEDARANADRPEQGDWWAETERAFAGPVTFVDSADVHLVDGGGSDAAGFVQIMRARCSDRERLEALEDEVGDLWREWRPDFIGGVRVWTPDSAVTAVDYFTSEEEARAGEASEPPADLVARFEEWQSLLSDTSWYDLPAPWLLSP